MIPTTTTTNTVPVSAPWAKRFFRSRLGLLSLSGTLVLTALGLGIIQGSTESAKKSSTGGSNAKPVVVVDDKPTARDGRIPSSFAHIVKKVSPSVVKVLTTVRGKEGPEFADPFLFRFFGEDFQGQRGGRPNLRTPEQRGVGSGVIVTEDGYILTNNHVVDGADDVRVALQDGRDFKARVIGRDPKTDVAVLKIDTTGLPHVTVADSDAIEVGDLALAVGNPFGIGQTVTMGMISAKGRGNMGLDYEDFIQTDAAINPGNSGGALVDAEGRLIGINTAILSRSGGNQGIGFAIPSNLARFVMDSLVEDGRVVRGYLGVSIQDVTPALAKEFKLKAGQGALIADVSPDSPAEKAGLQSGDIVTEFNGKPLENSRQLRLAVAATRPGTKGEFKVLRDGDRKTIAATLKELPEDKMLAQDGKSKKTVEDDGTLNGVTVSDLDRQARRQLGTPSQLQGALVTQVEPNSAASEAGLRPGDVITEINRRPVKDADEAVRMTEKKSKDKKTLLRVWNQGGTRYVVVDEAGEG